MVGKGRVGSILGGDCGWAGNRRTAVTTGPDGPLVGMSKHFLIRLCTSALVVAFAAAASLAQQPVPRRNGVVDAPAQPGWPTGHVSTDQAADGTVWVATAAWKAGFATGGTTFTPFLGSQVPSQSATFRLVGGSVDGADLVLADAVPVLAGQRVTFDRGALTEFYDLRPEGIEQQFLCRELPTRGELRLSIAVATELLAERAGDGFRFVGPHGGIRYGQATAIDAVGQRLVLSTQWQDGALQIVVPADFVATATLPLLVDPLIGSATSLASATAELTSTDIAYDHSLGQYYVVYERAFSATDHDVYVGCFDAVMQFQTLLSIDFTSDFWSKPRVATVEAQDVGCVVAERSVGNVRPFAVGYRRFHGGVVPSIEPNVGLLAGIAAVDYLDPVVGGDDGATGTGEFLFAWTGRDTVSGTSAVRLMNSNGNGVTYFATSVLVAGASTLRPAISKSCGRSGGGSASWAVVFRTEQPGAALGSLRAAVVEQAGPNLRTFAGVTSFVVATQVLATGSDWCVSSPTDLALGRRFLCVERRYDLLNQRGSLVGHVVDHQGNVLLGNAPITTGNLNQLEPAVDCDGARFAVVHATRYSATDTDVRCLTLGQVGNQLLQQDAAVVTASLDADAQPSVCAARGGEHNRHGVAWCREAVGGGFSVRAQVYHAVAAGGVAARATGCGGMGISAFGSPELGGLVQFATANLGSLQGFVAGQPVSIPIAACPGCDQGASGAVWLGNLLSVAIPLDVGLVGATLAVQAFHFAASGKPCLGQLEFSNTLDFTIR